ncbi:MAG TPA: hypothetical protein VFE32_19310 [Puia sp.]|jgi:hypothetical protein|nr:hypothetical protein [Puia sp.]
MNFIQRWRHTRSLAKMDKLMHNWHSQLEGEAHLVLDAIEIMEAKYGHHEIPFNQTTIGVFIKFSVMDIFLLYKILFKSGDERETNILARTLAIHIAEFIDDVGKLVGNPLAERMKKFPDDEDLKQALKNVRVWYNSIRIKYEGMRDIRNIVSAHQDPNVIKQLAINEKLNLDEFHILVLVNFQLFIGSYQKYERMLIQKINESSVV